MNFFKPCRFLFLTLFITGLLVDIFIFSSTNDLIFLLLTGFWVAFVIGSRLENRFSIALALVFLMISVHFLVLRVYWAAERTANWAYMFLVVGVIQQLIEFKRKPKDLINLNDFLKTLLKDFYK